MFEESFLNPEDAESRCWERAIGRGQGVSLRARVKRKNIMNYLGMKTPENPVFLGSMSGGLDSGEHAHDPRRAEFVRPLFVS